MSVFAFLILAAIGAEIEEAADRRRQRREWLRQAPRRARRYTFN